MQQDILKLMDAQRIDLDIDALIRHKKDYPAQMEELKQEVASLENELAETIERIKKNETNRGTIETEIAAEREKLASREERLLGTKTNKEYTAVQHEIVQSRERIDSLETEDLEMMTENDQLGPKKEALETQLEEKKSGNASLIAEIQEKFDSIESDIAVLDSKRTQALDGVNARTLAVYKRLRRGKSGIAIAVVDPVKHSCRGCFKQLPPQKVLELRRQNKIMFCENCGRILFWEDAE